MWTRNNVHTYNFTSNSFYGFSASICSSFHCSNISGDTGTNQRIADLLHRAGQFYVGRL